MIGVSTESSSVLGKLGFYFRRSTEDINTQYIRTGLRGGNLVYKYKMHARKRADKKRTLVKGEIII